MEKNIDYLIQSRQTCLSFIDQLSFNQINTIPKGFNNSILWNIGHLTVTQQLLNYKLSGIPMLIEDDIINLFRKGSQPKSSYAESEWSYILDQFKALPIQLKKDWSAGVFKKYDSYRTSFGVELNSIEDAITFNNIHEGIHIGYILALRRLV